VTTLLALVPFRLRVPGASMLARAHFELVFGRAPTADELARFQRCRAGG
jgi:hypothetical protein